VKSLRQVQDLYDRNLFLQAFRETAEYWQPSTDLQQLTTEELVFASRLAHQLGGWRLSRWLLRTVVQRDPANPLARYFAYSIAKRSTRLLDDLYELQLQPDLGGDDVELRAGWFAYHARSWAVLRDFSRAYDWIARAQALVENDSWVYSCQSEVYGLADRWDDALVAAERAWELSFGAPFAANSLSNSLLNLGRVPEAAQRLTAAAENCESYQVAHLACWHQCALAETMEMDGQRAALDKAIYLLAKLIELAPLADRQLRKNVAISYLDIAELSDDHVAMEKWAAEVRSPFHREILANLRKNGPSKPIRLPFRPTIQKHNACLPTSVASALATVGVDFSIAAMTHDLTFGGTYSWAAADWLRKHDLAVRFFAVTPEVATRLVQHGIGFVVSFAGDESAHAVAVVGLDEAAGTLLVHDPEAFRTSRYLVKRIGQNQAPLAPKGMVAVPSAKAALLDQLLPDDAEVMDASEAHHRALVMSGPSEARAIVLALQDRRPSHPGTRLLQAIQAGEDGRTGEAFTAFKSLLEEFPSSPIVRARLIDACRALGNTALLRETLHSIIETGVLPGIQSQQDWVHPPARYLCEYAEVLSASAATRSHARFLLFSVIRRHYSAAYAWHALAHVLWREHNIERSLLCYRLASCLVESDEHDAHAYCEALGRCGREQEGLDWLEARVRAHGASPRAVGTWLTWIAALEDAGRPQSALSACEEALQQHGSSPELLAFVVPFLARMGHWQEAEENLGRLESVAGLSLFHSAAMHFHHMRCDLDRAIQHADVWVREAPRSMQARYLLLDLAARRDGAVAAVDLAERWMAEQPAHEDLETAYCHQLERDFARPTRFKKYSLLLRRLKRNPEDGWAWRELVFTRMEEYVVAGDARRRKLEPRIVEFLAECDRVAPEDAATVRAHARWHEVRGQWSEAVAGWLDAIDRDPSDTYSYQHIWNSSATLDRQQSQQLWGKIELLMLSFPGHLSTARDMAALLAERFGADEAEGVVLRWRGQRPEDPNVLEALVDLLLEHGHGRSAAERALALLQTSIEHLPRHSGLRLSLATAYRMLGQEPEAEQAYEEIVRRHPGHTEAIIQLAWIQERGGKGEDALRALQTASSRDRRNFRFWESQAQMLVRAGQVDHAATLIRESLRLMPEVIRWRTRAISILSDCGAHEEAIEAARDGVRVYPSGAYLWLVLGRTLNDLPQFAAKGEVESCLRRSHNLNPGLFETADWLAFWLCGQRRHEEAEQIMRTIEPRLADPSPARGRLAWIEREQGRKHEALDEVIGTVAAAPWYASGWSMLMDWLAEDEAWERARSLFADIPPPLRTNTEFRQRRLSLLEKAGLAGAELDAEWESLLRDFPENVPLHLRRYDSLQSGKRLSEAAAVLRASQPSGPPNPFLEARFVEVLLSENQKDEALETALRVWFTPMEEAPWPAHKVLTAMESGGLADQLCREAKSRMEQGSKPTPRALQDLALQIMKSSGVRKRDQQSLLNSCFPEQGAREVFALLGLVDQAPWGDGRYRAAVFEVLIDHGYQRAVVRYWKKHPDLVNSDLESWRSVGRALVGLKKNAEGRKLLAGWRDRSGVAMWVVANYILTFSSFGAAQLREAAAACNDALAELPHDHCAKYLAHKQAEAFALLGDKQAFLETWNRYRNYFGTDPAKDEFFRQTYLLADIPAMAHLLQQNETKAYSQIVRSLRWRPVWQRLGTSGGQNPFADIPWWIWILLALWASQLVGSLIPDQ